MKHFKFLLFLGLWLSVMQGCAPASSTKVKQDNKTEVSTGEQIIVDVRSPEEWIGDGHADCTVNYPLPELDKKLEELKAYKKVIFVCRSGHRAGIATEMLKSAGYSNAENGGSWRNITCQ